MYHNFNKILENNQSFYHTQISKENLYMFGKPGKGIKAYIGDADKNKSKRKRLIPLFKQLFKRS